MSRSLSAVLLLLLLAAHSYGAKRDAAALTCDLLENYDAKGWQVVDNRQFTVPIELPYTLSMANFGCRFTVTKLADKAVNLETQLNSYDQQMQTFIDSRVLLEGASAFYDSVIVRERSLYRVRVTFDSLTKLDDNCQYLFGDTTFASDPSANFNFYFVRNTLGDFRWNEIRDVVEADYRRFAKQLEIDDPNRINYYISPCQLADVYWDSRWHSGADFSRANVFAWYNHGSNNLQPAIVNMTKLVRWWGYAPALLMEGVANWGEFHLLYAHDAMQAGKVPRLRSLGVSREFQKLEHEIAVGISGSFVNYLYTTRGSAKLRQFYRTASDLAFAESFARVYGESLDSLDNQWRQYLDTVTVSDGSFQYHLSRAQSFMKSAEVKNLAERYLAATNDTLRIGPTLAGIYFAFGEYAKTEKIFRIMLADSATAAIKGSIANIQLAQGKLKSAEENYLASIADDSLSYIPFWKLAQLAIDRGAGDSAVSLLRTAKQKPNAAPYEIDIDYTLGEAFAQAGKSDSSRFYFQRSLDGAKILVGKFTENPLHHMRVGRAALRLGSAKLAIEELNIAYFLEERMFYVGQILLARGQAHDLLGDREAALADYRDVSRLPTAHFDRKLAEKYLATPYHQ